ncbi:MAG TPA: Mur ligase family protein, partial [Parvularculaceae bacterium]|nr:Mur ligase family protein [Parvularculaceae bacterium]
EDAVPDIVAARRVGAARVTRADLLASLFNAAPISVGVAGTSGKSTTTAMIGWILHATGRDPTVMNGAVMKNFVSEAAPFASALVGSGGVFVSEVDESDGSIANFDPKIAVVTNISLDHKTMDELRGLFSTFAENAETAILNADNAETAMLAEKAARRRRITFGVEHGDADFAAADIEPRPFGVAFSVLDRADGARAAVLLKMPGRHNVANALAAIAAAKACGATFTEAAGALNDFAGVRRRLEFVGERAGVTVIDDFAHNPDKIRASLQTLHEFPGRLLVMFQPHGYGPLAKMKTEFIDCFAENLGKDDVLLMPNPAYFGGTVDRTVSSADIAAAVAVRGRKALHFETRDECGAFIEGEGQSGDRVVIMGARDDTLSHFAREILGRLK